MRRGSLVRISVLVVFALAAGILIGRVSVHTVSLASSQATVRTTGAHRQPDPALSTKVSASYAGTSAGGSVSATVSAPFTQCPAVGVDTSCADLIQLTGGGPARILADLSQGPYDGGGATLVGVVNDSGRAVPSITLQADAPLFTFAGTGLCTVGLRDAAQRTRCPFGTTGYEGPGTSFQGIGDDGRSGTIAFSPALPAGASAYFSLAQAPAATNAGSTTAAPNASEVGGPADPADAIATFCPTDSVDCATGELSEQYADMSVPGRGPALDLTRGYVSARAQDSASSPAPLGPGWSFSYGMTLTFSAGNSIATVTQENGSEVAFTRTGTTDDFTAAPWVQATLQRSRSGGGYMFFRRSDRLRFTFSPDGSLQSITDPDGLSTQLIYDNGLLDEVIDPAQRVLQFSWNGGLLQKVTDPLGRVTQYQYANGDLSQVTDEQGDVWQYGYRSAGNVLNWIKDPSGNVTSFQYTSSAPYRVKQQNGPLAGEKQTWAYQGDAATPAGGRTTYTSAIGHVTVDDFADLQLTSATAGAGTTAAATTSYAYGPTGQATSLTDPNGQVTTSDYDDAGDLVSTTDPLGRTAVYGYDALGDETSRTTALGQTTRWQYSRSGDLQSVMDALGGVTTLIYEGIAAGDVTEVVYPAGNKIDYAYDFYGDVTSTAVLVPSRAADVSEQTFDLDGEPICQADPDATAQGVHCPSDADAAHVDDTTTIAYSQGGRVVTTTDATGKKATATYRWDGSLASNDNAAGETTAYTYNALGEQLTTTVGAGTPAAAVTSTSYYPDGSVETRKEGAGQQDTYTYDAAGFPLTQTDAMKRVTSFAYDRAGQLLQQTQPTGEKITYGYDADGETTGEAYSDPGTPAVGYAYDADGERVQMTDGTGTTTYAYDADRRLTETVDGAGATVGYQYNADGNITALTYPGSKSATYVYNGAQQLVKVTDWLGNTVSFSYDADGSVNSEHFPGGVTQQDANPAPASAGCGTADAPDAGASTVTDTAGDAGGTGSNPELAQFTDCTDPVGRLLSQTSSTAQDAKSTDTYTYDAAGRLASADGAAYTFNAAGEATTLAGVTQKFDADGELLPSSTGSTASSTSTGSGYDSNGDQLTLSTPQGAAALTYNGADELTSYKVGSATATYTYNGDGLRSAITVGGQTEQQTWQLGQAVSNLLSDGTEDYVYGPGNLPIEQISAAGAQFLLADQSGDTRLLLSDDGEVQATYSYSPTGAASQTLPGQPAAPVAGGPAPLTALLYRGQYTDAISGLVYLRARYYAPSTAMFLSADPLATATGERYGYADGDPVNGSDPSGMICWSLSCLTNDVTGAASAVWDAGASVVHSVVRGTADVIDAVVHVDVFVHEIQQYVTVHVARWVYDHSETLAKIAEYVADAALAAAVISMVIPGAQGFTLELIALYGAADKTAEALHGLAAIHALLDGDPIGALQNVNDARPDSRKDALSEYIKESLEPAEGAAAE